MTAGNKQGSPDAGITEPNADDERENDEPGNDLDGDGRQNNAAKPEGVDGAEPGDDPLPPQTIQILATDAATSEALKALESPTQDLWSTDPEKEKARWAIETAYRAATEQPDGSLWGAYQDATEEFLEATKHLTRKEPDGSDPLGNWLDKYLRHDSDLYKFLATLPNLKTRVWKLKGKRERERDALRKLAAAWADAHRAWSDPIGSITALLEGLAEKIQVAHGQFGQKYVGDYAIYRVWFEYAPIILQLSPDPPDETTAPGFDRLQQKLGKFPDVLARLTSGYDRKDGSLFLLRLDGGPNDLRKHRQWVLKRWRASLEQLGKAEADFNLRPDDLAALVPRLKDRIDREVEIAKDTFPAPPSA